MDKLLWAKSLLSCSSHFIFFLIFIVIQLQFYAFSPHPSTRSSHFQGAHSSIPTTTKVKRMNLSSLTSCRAWFTAEWVFQLDLKTE